MRDLETASQQVLKTISNYAYISYLHEFRIKGIQQTIRPSESLVGNAAYRARDTTQSMLR